jgi:hypothetical protein
VYNNHFFHQQNNAKKVRAWNKFQVGALSQTPKKIIDMEKNGCN